MKLRTTNHCRGFTLLEALIILFILSLLAAMFLPAIGGPKRKAPRISCVNNLKQIGLSYRVWANDHDGDYPMDVSMTNGGVSELFKPGCPFSQYVYLNYLIISNELSTPKILHCPSDIHTTMATNFGSRFYNGNVSYFASPGAKQSLPLTILSGDANISYNGDPLSSGLVDVPTNWPVAWTEERHVMAGNIGLADGSAQQVTTAGLQEALSNTGLQINHLIIP